MIICLCLLCACSQKSETLVSVKVTVEKGRQTPDSVLFEKQDIVFLETTEESLIRFVTSVARIDTFLYVFDTLQDYVFIFNQEGKFIARAGTIGQGPREYTGLNTFCIDPVHREFIAATDPPTRLQFYSLSGEFIAETKIPDELTEMACLHDEVIAWASVNEEYDLVRYRIKNHQLTAVEPIKTPMVKIHNFIYPGGSFLSSIGDTLFYTRRYSDVIYTVEENGIKPYCRFDFGPYTPSLGITMSREQLLKEGREVVMGLTSITKNGSRMLMHASPQGLFLYDESKGTIENYGSIENGKLKTSGQETLPLWSEHPDMVVFMEEMDQLKLLAKHGIIKDEALAEKILASREDANPVLCFYYLR